MPVATAARPINLRLKSSTPSRILHDIHKRYARFLVEDDALEDYFKTRLSRKMETSMTPGAWIRTARDAYGWTQARLAAELGNVSSKRISDWESGQRAVSKEAAKKLSGIFLVSPEKFI